MSARNRMRSNKRMINAVATHDVPTTPAMKKKTTPTHTPSLVVNMLQVATVACMSIAAPPKMRAANFLDKKDRKIGKAGMHRDRILQKAVTKSQLQRKDRLLIARANKRLRMLRSNAKAKYTAKDVSRHACF